MGVKKDSQQEGYEWGGGREPRRIGSRSDMSGGGREPRRIGGRRDMSG